MTQEATRATPKRYLLEGTPAGRILAGFLYKENGFGGTLLVLYFSYTSRQVR